MATYKYNFKKEPTVDGFVTEKTDVLANSLLGEYNRKGKYIICPQIITELTQVRKYKRNSFNNAVYAVAQSKMLGEIVFEIVFKKNTKQHLASATLCVLEKVQKINGYIQNTLKTPIAFYKADFGASFIEDALREFNVVTELGGRTREDDKLDDQIYINAKKGLNDRLADLSFDELNVAYEEYFNQRMEILKSLDNPFARDVLAAYQAEYDKIKNFFLNKKGKIPYKDLNELLDKVMEDNSGLSPQAKKWENEYRLNILPFLRKFMIQTGTLETSNMKKVQKDFPKNRKDEYKDILDATIESRENQEPINSLNKVMDRSPESTKQETPIEISQDTYRQSTYESMRKAQESDAEERTEKVASKIKDATTKSPKNNKSEETKEVEKKTKAESENEKLMAETEEINDLNAKIDSVPKYETEGFKKETTDKPTDEVPDIRIRPRSM